MLPKSNNNAEQNLIFAGLGLQLGMLSKEQVIRAFTEWLFDKSKALPQILLNQKAMEEDRIKMLKLAVEAHIQKEGTSEKALASLHMVKDLESDLDHLGDQDLHATLDSAVVQRKQLGLDEQFTKSHLSDVSERKSAFTFASPDGTTKERFERQQFFDAGNLGELYFAKDTELNRTVVAKYIKPERANEGLTQALFHLEGEVTGALEHPSIVPVYGLGKDAKGRLFYAMRYIRGRKLSRVISDYHAIPQSESGKRQEALVGLLQNFQAACLAIEYAHMKGVLHCDIKPDNIMIGDYGEVFVVDWGLVIVHGEAAKKFSSNEDTFATLEVGQIPPYRPSDTASSGLHQNQGGSRRGVGGTPAYMAPEQLQATFEEDVTQLGPGVDIYALGGVLFQILTGKPPHLSRKKSRESMEDFQKRILSGDFPKPRDLNGEIPKPLESIALKALSLKPEKRYECARELSEDVKRWLADEPVQAFKEGWVAKTQRLARKNRTAVAVAGLLFVFLAISCFGYTLVTQSYNEKLQISEKNAVASAAEAKDQKLKAEANEKTAIANATEAQIQRDKSLINEKLAKLAQETAEKQLYINKIQMANIEWKFGNSIANFDQLETIPFNQRGWEHHFLNTVTISNQFTLKGHSNFIYSVAFSPDGKQVISGSTDTFIKIWDSSSGQEIKTLRGHTKPVIAVAISPDGKRIASGGAENTIKVWDAYKGVEIHSLEGHSQIILSLAFTPDGNRIISASEDKTIKVWDTASGKEIKTLGGHEHSVPSVACSPDGKQIISGSKDKTVKVWDIETGKETHTLKGHLDVVNTVTFSPDGKRIASGSWDHTLKVWDVKNASLIYTINELEGMVVSVAFSPDGKRIAAGTGDSAIRIWDSTNGQITTTLKGHTSLAYIAFSPDGRRLVSGSEDNTIKIWNLDNEQTLEGHTSTITKVAFSPDQKRIITAGWDSILKIWDSASGREISTLTGHQNSIGWFAFSPDGNRMISCSGDRTIKLWDAANGQDLATFKGHTDGVSSASFSPDGKKIVSGSADKTIKIWDAANGQELFTLKGHTDTVTSVNFSPDGKKIASGSFDATVKLWDAITHQEIKTLYGHSAIVSSTIFSPDGKRIASGSWDRTIKIWDVENGQEITTLKRHTNNVNSVAFSSDGKRIVSSSDDKTIKVWDSESLQEIITLRGHTDKIHYANFSPDGRQIVSGSWDKTARIWRGTRAHEFTRLSGHKADVSRATISPDGKFILSEDHKGIKKLWKTDDCKEWPLMELKTLSELFPDQSATSQDKEWSVEFHGADIFLINNKLRQERIAQDKDNLARWAAPNPNWHFAQAKEAEKNQEWFAATFHLKKLLEFDSHKEDAKKRLADIEPKLKVN